MKIQLLALFLAFAAVTVFGQNAESLPQDQLRSYGTGVVLVPIDRAALTITATGIADSASEAVNDATALQGRINASLANYTIYDIRNGGLYLQPLYSGSSLSFGAHLSLSVVVNAADVPIIIDNLIALGASNISFIFTPDFYAIELAQRQSLQLAVVDALYKAQAVLDSIRHCAINITRIAIRNPAVELPSITFSLFANMGNPNNLNVYNINLQGSPLNGGQQGGNQGNRGNNNLNFFSPPMMLGAGAPVLEGSREEVVSYLDLWVTHDLCSAQTSGMVSSLTSSLDLSNIVGISGGTLTLSPISSPSASPSGSPSGSPLTHARSARTSMW